MAAAVRPGAIFGVGKAAVDLGGGIVLLPVLGTMVSVHRRCMRRVVPH